MLLFGVCTSRCEIFVVTNAVENQQEPSSWEDHKLYAYDTLGRICSVCSEATAIIGPCLVFVGAVCAEYITGHC